MSYAILVAYIPIIILMHIPPYQLGPTCGKINTNQQFFEESHSTLLHLMGSFLMGHAEVIHSLLYYGLLIVVNALLSDIYYCY